MADKTGFTANTQVMALTRYAGVGPRLFEALMTRYGSLEGIFGASDASLDEIQGATGSVSEKVAKARENLQKAKGEIDSLASREIRVVTRVDQEYPDRLSELNDPPPLLYVRGKMPDNLKKTVTLVGSTRASSEGIELTVQLARRFVAEGVQVVSSLREGIDTAAHLGARSGDQYSFAVVEMGFDQISGPEQMPLAIDSLRSGGVISEYPPEEKIKADNYIQTNRLLVGISHAVVFTEVYFDSVELLDLAEFCSQIGKLAFFMLHPQQGPLSDSRALDKMTEYGVIPINGPAEIDKIIAALV